MFAFFAAGAPTTGNARGDGGPPFPVTTPSPSTIAFSVRPATEILAGR